MDMLDILKQINAMIARSMAHETGHAVTAHDYGFPVEGFYVQVINDPTGATYKGRVGVEMTDEKLAALDKGKKSCWAIMCAAGVAAEAVMIGDIAKGNLIELSADRNLLAKVTTQPLEDFIEDANVLVNAKREVHRKVAEHLEKIYREWIQAHTDVKDGLYLVADKQTMATIFAQHQDARNRLMDEKYGKEDVRKAWVTTWAHEAGHAVVAEHLGLPLRRVIISIAPDGYATFACIYDWQGHTFPKTDTLETYAHKVSTAAAAGSAAEILLNGKAQPASFDPQNPDNVQILTLAKKIGAPDGTTIETFIPHAKKVLELHRRVLNEASAFFLKKADAFLAEILKPENWGKEIVVASREELDDLLKKVRPKQPTYCSAHGGRRIKQWIDGVGYCDKCELPVS